MVVTKKGLSDIITNVLIILLVLVAISIIWFFVRPTIQQGAGALGGAGDCLTIQLEPVSCNIAVNGDYSAQIRRNPGEGQLQGLILQVTGDNNQAIALNAAQTIAIGETKTISGTDTGLPSLTTPRTLKIAAVVKTDNAEGKICDLNPTPITCT